MVCRREDSKFLSAYEAFYKPTCRMRLRVTPCEFSQAPILIQEDGSLPLRTRLVRCGSLNVDANWLYFHDRIAVGQALG
jgi:hypothetical protein